MHLKTYNHKTLTDTSFIYFLGYVAVKCRLVQASTDEDGRLRTVNPSMWTTDENLGSDRPSHGQIRTLDQACNFIVDEWTDFFYHGPSNSWTESDNRPRLSF